MTVYDLSNVTVVPVGDPARAYRINSNEGYYIHLPSYEDNVFTTAVVLLASYDFSTVQIVAEADLPEDNIINGNTTPEVEVMAEGGKTVTEIE